MNSCGEDDLILILDVDASTDHVIARRNDGAVFLRQGDRSVELNHDQITALEYDKNQRRFEDEVADRSSIDDIDPEVMAHYKEELGTDVSDEQVLRSRSMLVDGTSPMPACFSSSGTQRSSFPVPVYAWYASTVAGWRRGAGST